MTVPASMEPARDEPEQLNRTSPEPSMMTGASMGPARDEPEQPAERCHT